MITANNKINVSQMINKHKFCNLRSAKVFISYNVITQRKIDSLFYKCKLPNEKERALNNQNIDQNNCTYIAK